MTTPARRQYLRIKKEHQDAILLFRMGDFFETFDDDARTISKELDIALTSREMGRGQRIPLAGIPYHALEPYLARLIRKGYRVAICEQTSDPAQSKGLVDREVVRVVTAGTVVEDSLLETKANNYLAAVVVNGERAGLANVDITTGEFATAEMDVGELGVELARLTPAEVLVQKDAPPPSMDSPGTFTELDSDAFDPHWAKETLQDHFGVRSLEAFGCEGLPLATQAAGGIVDYLRKNQKDALGQIRLLYTYSTASFMTLDPQTRRNLELFEGGRWSDTAASLLSVLDKTRTAMGGRLIRRWLGQPLREVDELVERQSAVGWFHRSDIRRSKVQEVLAAISDVERLINRVRGGTGSPRDLVGLAHSLALAPDLRALLDADADADAVKSLAAELADNSEVVNLIGAALVDDPPAAAGDGRTVRQGFSEELDSLRDASRDAKSYVANMERLERERTGIKSLKVGYNKVFGYYIEVSKSNVEQVPDNYVRRQTLVGGERYITPEMKEYESRILNAQDRIAEIEVDLFRRVCRQVGESVAPIMATAQAMAKIDALCSLGEVASRNGYVKPQLNDGLAIHVKQGRHPVVERMLDSGDFVPNDIHLDSGDEQLIILTGPNMAGKSTFIRQVAVITLMAQIGSFVPAESATIGLVDRIFTRVGLQDDLALGQSTFMVEMIETASILNHATSRSLLILDEIGRGTSTYDGLAIARAVAEHIHNHPRLGCRTLFATHYHELTQLAEVLPRVRNYNVAVSEDGGNVVFLRRIVPGGADRSYGVHVARLAGLPGSVINRAWDVLKLLENGAASNGGISTGKRNGRSSKGRQALQMPLLGPPTPAIEELLAIDVASMTPIEAINKLYELQEQMKAQR